MYAERTERTTSEKDKTGIPRRMKAGFEHSSGFSFDDVRVHYNSEKPAQLHAHAYTQGNEVYVAPGQEKHLPHELGHVVQQKSDMVKPTGEIGGLLLNDDEAMENDADMIATKAQTETPLGTVPVQTKTKNGIVQASGFMDFMSLASSSQSYNLFAGPLSTLTSLGGMIGGIASFLYTKNAERKHRYIEEIEKYADAACDAREEQIAAKVQFNNSTSHEDIKNAFADAVKQKSKIERNFKAAKDKAVAMGELKEVDLATIDVGGIKNANVKNALSRANEAYIDSRNDFGENENAAPQGVGYNNGNGGESVNNEDRRSEPRIEEPEDHVQSEE